MSEALGDIRNLGLVYSYVLDEPIPEHWCELLAKLDEKPADRQAGCN